LLGELHIDADKVVDVTQLEAYHPVSWNGAKVKLHYAKAGDLADYLNLTAILGEVVVQFWLQPGDAMVDLKFSGNDAGNRIPGILKNF
ncbi:MAG: metal-dependent hydrolase, partial [Methylomicrobium sp.]|nr:metal-dependent hydrolase [Methylomicrobium sp.]